MRFFILLFLFCGCTYRGWYITEAHKENKNECYEVTRERLNRSRNYKKVYYKIKKECREEYKQRKEYYKKKKKGV